MRNFTSVSRDVNTFSSINCGNEYKTGNPDSILRSVVLAVVRAFECADKHVDCALSIVTDLDDLFDQPSTQNAGFTTSELEALSELRVFYFEARKRFDSSNYFSYRKGNQSFVYININTGVSVVWTSALM